MASPCMSQVALPVSQTVNCIYYYTVLLLKQARLLLSYSKDQEKNLSKDIYLKLKLFVYDLMMYGSNTEKLLSILAEKFHATPKVSQELTNTDRTAFSRWAFEVEENVNLNHTSMQASLTALNSYDEAHTHSAFPLEMDSPWDRSVLDSLQNIENELTILSATVAQLSPKSEKTLQNLDFVLNAIITSLASHFETLNELFPQDLTANLDEIQDLTIKLTRDISSVSSVLGKRMLSSLHESFPELEEVTNSLQSLLEKQGQVFQTIVSL